MSIYYSIFKLFSSHKPAAINSLLQLLFACTSCSRLFQLQHKSSFYITRTFMGDCSEFWTEWRWRGLAQRARLTRWQGAVSEVIAVSLWRDQNKKAIQRGWADIAHADISIKCHVSTWTRFKSEQVNRGTIVTSDKSLSFTPCSPDHWCFVDMFRI